jgi:hypothetical protein
MKIDIEPEDRPQTRAVIDMSVHSRSTAIAIGIYEE